jgi:hypothetical protein
MMSRGPLGGASAGDSRCGGRQLHGMVALLAVLRVFGRRRAVAAALLEFLARRVEDMLPLVACGGGDDSDVAGRSPRERIAGAHGKFGCGDGKRRCGCQECGAGHV